MFDDAAMVLEEIAPEDKTRNEVLGARVNLYMLAKKWDMAAAVASHLVKVDPQTAEWWINLAYAVRRAESVEKAEIILLRAQAIHPKNALIVFNLACYASVTGRIEEAKGHVESTEERRVFALIVITASSFPLPAPRPSRKLVNGRLYDRKRIPSPL